MGLKLVKEEIRNANDAFIYSDDTKRLIFKEYRSKDDYLALSDLEKILINSMDNTQSRELKLGIEIILILILHKDEKVRASALGKLFLLIDDEHIKKLIIKELKNISYYGNDGSKKLAQQSLDLIATEINKLEMIESIFDLLTELLDKIKLKIVQPKFAVVIYLNNKKNVSPNTSKSKMNRKIVYPDNLFGNLVCNLRIFKRRIERMIPYLEEMEDLSYESHIEHEIIYSNFLSLEAKEDSLRKLAHFYSQTFMEKGHLRKLVALLDDNDYNIQQVGIDALNDVVEFLLTNSNEKKLIKLSNNIH